MGRYPFGVEHFHLLLHAGLSRRFLKYSNRNDTSGSCPPADHRWSAPQARLLAPHKCGWSRPERYCAAVWKLADERLRRSAGPRHERVVRRQRRIRSSWSRNHAEFGPRSLMITPPASKNHSDPQLVDTPTRRAAAAPFMPCRISSKYRRFIAAEAFFCPPRGIRTSVPDVRNHK